MDVSNGIEADEWDSWKFTDVGEGRKKGGCLYLGS